ncbi:MAG: hypothetical protein ACTHJ8_15435 [Mucilaginibacter sp.]
MMLTLKIIVLITLLFIFFQDVRSRSVYVVLLAALALLLSVAHYLREPDFSSLWLPALINMTFVALQFLLLTVYFSVRRHKMTNILKAQMIGPGDWLFFLSTALYLSVANFLFFYIISLLCVLLGWLLWNGFSPKSSKYIPLAGLQALIFIFFLAADWWAGIFNLTDDTWLMNLIN